MKVSDLYANNPLRGQDCYIIGSGPTIDLIDQSVFVDRPCVLLNEAHKAMPGIGPIAFANNKKQLRDCVCPIQVVKGRLRFDPNPEQTDNHVPWDSEQYHVFSYRNPPWDKVSHHDDTQLWKEPDFYWAPKDGSVSAFAIQFAVLCGAKSITLAGCDCCHFGGKEYADECRRKMIVAHNYERYAVGIMRLKRECKRLGIPLNTLSPFAGFGREQEQFPLLEALWRK